MVASLRSVSRFWTNNQRIVFFLSGGLHLCLSMNTWSCQMLAPIIFPIITGSCPNNSKELNDANLNFIKTHPLMNDAVPPFFNHPVLIRTGLNMAFTSIAVDPQVFQDGVTLIRHHLFFLGGYPWRFKVWCDLCGDLERAAAEGGQLVGAQEHRQHQDGDHRGDRGGCSSSFFFIKIATIARWLPSCW